METPTAALKATVSKVAGIAAASRDAAKAARDAVAAQPAPAPALEAVTGDASGGAQQQG